MSSRKWTGGVVTALVLGFAPGALAQGSPTQTAKQTAQQRNRPAKTPVQRPATGQVQVGKPAQAKPAQPRRRGSRWGFFRRLGSGIKNGARRVGNGIKNAVQRPRNQQNPAQQPAQQRRR